MIVARPLPAHLTPAERAALLEFTESVRRLLGAELLEARLFGSRARGDGDEDSDVDVALIVTAAGRARRYEVYDLAFDLRLRTGIAIAPSVIERPDGGAAATRATDRDGHRPGGGPTVTDANCAANAAEELARAEECLKEAHALHVAGLPFGVASRAYYAVFHAVRAR